MVSGTLGMSVNPAKREEFMQVVSGAIGPTGVMPGCISCNLCIDALNWNRVVFQSTWESRSDLNRFLRSREFTALLLATELLDESPDLCFDEIQRTEGMETVEKARLGATNPGSD